MDICWSELCQLIQNCSSLQTVSRHDGEGDHGRPTAHPHPPSPLPFSSLLQVLSCDLTLTPWTTAGKTRRAKQQRKVRLEGMDAGEEEREPEAREGLTPDEIENTLSKNEMRRLKKEQRKKEV